MFTKGPIGCVTSNCDFFVGSCKVAYKVRATAFGTFLIVLKLKNSRVFAVCMDDA